MLGLLGKGDPVIAMTTEVIAESRVSLQGRLPPSLYRPIAVALLRDAAVERHVGMDA
jgi:hypothetical protein